MKIVLTKKTGEIFDCYFDDEDYQIIKKYTWYPTYSKHNDAWYAKTTIQLGKIGNKQKTQPLYLHRLVLGLYTNDGGLVDHINNDTMDNRKSNLRMIENNQNLKNRKGANSNNTSGYRNVTWMGGFWRIQLQINGKNHLFVEKFEDVDDAGEFAKRMRNIYYGEFSGKG